MPAGSVTIIELEIRLQGMFSDSTLLDISDVELADIKFLEDDPVIVVQFNCQQVGFSCSSAPTLE